MGGTESKIDDDDAVSRCKLRHQFKKEAVSIRNAFAAAHAAYTKSLKNTGAALSDYVHRDFFRNRSSFTATVPAALPPSLLPPPPPPPLPPIKIQPARKMNPETVRPTEIKDEELEFELMRKPRNGRARGPKPETVRPANIEYEEIEFEWLEILRTRERLKNVGGKIERRTRKQVSLMRIFAVLDDHFLEASECASEVSALLEAIRMNFHFNFADNRGEIDHSKSVMDIITRNPSFQGMAGVDDDKDDFNAEETENHATLSDKMLAWEEKLFDEVKAMKREYQNKVVLLNKQKKWASNRESVEKIKASLCQMHARYIVDMQSVDAVVAEINHLRDDHLYPKLIQLVDGMATMWETMRDHHEIQLTYVQALKSLDHSQVQIETSEYHFERTIQLCEIVRDWHAQFCRLVDYQKDYVRALYNWLKLCPVPIESNLKEKVCSPPMNLPIHELVIAWNDDLDKLPDEVARSAISNFSAVIQTIVYLQEEEIKQRQKIKGTRKELERKGIQNQFKNGVTEELNLDKPVNVAKVEKGSVVISLRRQLEEEQEQCQKICRQVREKSLANLKQHLPELFRALSEFSLACSVMYSNLKSVAENE